MWSHSVEAQEELRRQITRAAVGEQVRYLVDVLAGDSGRALLTVDLELSPVRGGDGSVRFLLAEAKLVQAPAGQTQPAWLELLGDLMTARQATEQLRRLATGLAEAATIARSRRRSLSEPLMRWARSSRIWPSWSPGPT